MANYLGNAFSLQMLYAVPSTVKVEAVSSEEIPDDAVSCIGHPDTAAVMSSILGRHVPYNRVNVTLTDGDVLYVAQVIGGRLPEGATTLPEGFALQILRVTASYNLCKTR